MVISLDSTYASGYYNIGDYYWAVHKDKKCSLEWLEKGMEIATDEYFYNALYDSKEDGQFLNELLYDEDFNKLVKQYFGKCKYEPKSELIDKPISNITSKEVIHLTNGSILYGNIKSKEGEYMVIDVGGSTIKVLTSMIKVKKITQIEQELNSA